MTLGNPSLMPTCYHPGGLKVLKPYLLQLRMPVPNPVPNMGRLGWITCLTKSVAVFNAYLDVNRKIIFQHVELNVRLTNKPKEGAWVLMGNRRVGNVSREVLLNWRVPGFFMGNIGGSAMSLGKSSWTEGTEGCLGFYCIWWSCFFEGGCLLVGEHVGLGFKLLWNI